MRSAEKIAATQHNSQLDTLAVRRLDLVTIMFEHFRLDTRTGFSTQRFTTELEQKGSQTSAQTT
jgi:hypothetical protein